ncbi:MAG: hypothetical protein J7J89_05200 [Thermoplasmata archaeon]|nr:hypothetical protein [Thermoplasmata archaeon]
MKKAYISSLLNELKIEKISENAISIAIYRSYASGDKEDAEFVYDFAKKFLEKTKDILGI